MLAEAEQVLAQQGWDAQGSTGLTGPHTITDALAMAAFPVAPDPDDQAAMRVFILAWIR